MGAVSVNAMDLGNEPSIGIRCGTLTGRGHVMVQHRTNRRGERIISLSRATVSAHRKLKTCQRLEHFIAQVEADGLTKQREAPLTDVLDAAIHRYCRYLRKRLVKLANKRPHYRKAILTELSRWDARHRPEEPRAGASSSTDSATTVSNLTPAADRFVPDGP